MVRVWYVRYVHFLILFLQYVPHRRAFQDDEYVAHMMADNLPVGMLTPHSQPTDMKLFSTGFPIGFKFAAQGQVSGLYRVGVYRGRGRGI